MTRVEELLARAKADVSARKQSSPIDPSHPEFPADDRRVRWSKRRFHIIAEAKRSSLSAGAIRPGLELEGLVGQYEASGATAVSILTEPHYFHGSLADLKHARAATKLPVLQKDFILEEYQILEAKIAGADFVLLIVRFLTDNELERMLQLCERIGMNALVEVTEAAEIERLPFTPAFLGVNARNLSTLEMDLEKFARLRKYLPETFLIAESGIQDDATLRSVISLGYNGALIGEHFLRCPDPGKEVARFLSISSRLPFEHAAKPLVKICGITGERDALDAVAAGADALGFIFAESPRKIDTNALLRIRHRIPERVLAVGVFKDQPESDVVRQCSRYSLDVAQVYNSATGDKIAAQELRGTETWSARMFHSEEEMQSKSGNHRPGLWDLKFQGPSQLQAWQWLSGQKVFALAGNLNPDNVGKAVQACSPQWVDVASGVESAPGIKDKQKMRAFVKAARQA